MKVRFASPTDKPQVLKLLSQLGKSVNIICGYDYKNENAEIYGSKNFDKVMKSDSIKIFVLEENHIIFGLASYFLYTDMINGDLYAHMDDIIIDESKRKKGLGTLLMNAIIDYSRKNNIKAVKLVSFPEIQKFYLKFGAKISNVAMNIEINP